MEAQNVNCCFGNNPSSPYGLPLVKTGYYPDDPSDAECSPLQFLDPTLLYTDTDRPADVEQLRAMWRLQPNEAIVFIGWLPPNDPDYVGFTAYVMNKAKTPDAGQPYVEPVGLDLDGQITYDNCGSELKLQKLESCFKSPSTPYLNTFSSTGNSLNGKTLNQGTHETDDKGPFTIIIITGDHGTDARIRESLEDQGVSQDLMNTLWLSPELFNMGWSNGTLMTPASGIIEPASDIFGVLVRVAYLGSEPDEHPYFENPRMDVYRVTPPSTALADYWETDRYYFPPKGTGTTEIGHYDDLERSKGAVKDSLSGYYLSEHTVKDAALTGINCYKAGESCYGDNGDTLYSRALFGLPWEPSLLEDLAGTDLEDALAFCISPEEYGDSLSLPLEFCDFVDRYRAWSADSEDFFVVIGMDHRETGKATYSSVSLYQFKDLRGAGSVTSHEMKGSDYASELMGDDYVEGLFAFRFVRSEHQCPGGVMDENSCKVVPSDPDAPNGDYVTDGSHVLFIERSYVEPETKRGSLASEILPARVIRVSKTQFSLRE
jgi:hypothetical protein